MKAVNACHNLQILDILTDLRLEPCRPAIHFPDSLKALRTNHTAVFDAISSEWRMTGLIFLAAVLDTRESVAAVVEVLLC